MSEFLRDMMYNNIDPTNKLLQHDKDIEDVKTDLAESIKYKTEWLSVKSFGAKGDCVLDSNGNYVLGTDDTQKIIDSINGTPAGGVLLFPPGKYYISSINLTRSDITIIGYGATIVTSVTTSTVPNTLTINGSNISILGLSFTSPSTFNVDTTVKAPASGGGLMLRIGSTGSTYNSNILIRDVKTQGSFGAIDIQKCSNVRVLNCDVLNSIGNGINFADCPRDVWCEGNTVMGTRDDGIVCVCDANYMQGTENWIVRNNRIEKSYAKGIGSTGVNSGVIENNWIKNTWTAGILIFQDSFYSLAKSRNVKIKGNTIIDAGKNYGTGQFKTAVSTNCDGVYISADTKSIDILDNNIFTPKRYGIYVGNGAKRVRIRNNEVLAPASIGINIGDTADTTLKAALDISITDNNVTDTQAHGIVIGGVNEGIIARNKVKSYLDGNRCIYMKNVQNLLVTQNVSNNKITSVWSANSYYYAGQYILPTTSNGHSYKCTVSGLTGSTEPTWDTTGGTNTDGTATWQDNGAVLTRGVASTPYIDSAGSSVGVQVTTDNYLLNN